MTEEDAERGTTRERCITEIVTAYVRSNRVPRSEMLALIATVAEAVDGIAAQRPSSVAEPTVKLTEAEIRTSIQRDRLISFIDGKPYKALKRHLLYKGYTAESYRARYGLPLDYPMVATSYSERRTELSQQNSAKQRSSMEWKMLQ